MSDYVTITGTYEGFTVRGHYSEIAPGVWEAELEWQDDYGYWHNAGYVTLTREPDLAAIAHAVESYCADQYDRVMEDRAAGY